MLQQVVRLGRRPARPPPATAAEIYADLNRLRPDVGGSEGGLTPPMLQHLACDSLVAMAAHLARKLAALASSAAFNCLHTTHRGPERTEWRLVRTEQHLHKDACTNSPGALEGGDDGLGRHLGFRLGLGDEAIRGAAGRHQVRRLLHHRRRRSSSGSSRGSRRQAQRDSERGLQTCT